MFSELAPLQGGRLTAREFESGLKDARVMFGAARAARVKRQAAAGGGGGGKVRRCRLTSV